MRGVYNNGDGMLPDEDIMIFPQRALSRESIRHFKSHSNPPQVTLSGSDSNANRELWIKIDAGYLVTKNLKDIQGPALAIVLERLKHSGAFQETFDVAKTISMGPSLKSGSKVGKFSSNGNGDRRAGNRAVSSNKEGTVFEFHGRKSSLGVCDFSFRRQLFVWEMEDCSQLIHLLQCCPILNESVDDKLVWKADGSGLFSVKSVYDSLNLGTLTTVPRSIWMNIAPSKMQFTCWLAWKGRLKTSVFLHSIGVLDPFVAPLCILCSACDEDANNVLLHSSFSWKIRTEILSWWGIIWVIPQSMSHLLEWWDGFKFKKLEKSIWGTIPAAVIWNLWKARNGCKFVGLTVNWEGL
ncbi:unnamed protein product [Camellia sinensis]